jgi:hypothetical protein
MCCVSYFLPNEADIALFRCEKARFHPYLVVG